MKKNQVVVVTGASAGVGRATVQAFARKGSRIGLIGRSQDALNDTQSEVEALGGTAVAVPCDVADANAVEKAAEVIEEKLGPIDIWINNAMVSVFSPVKEMTAEEFHRVTEVTYLGFVHGTLSALRRMLPRDRGVIIQVSSGLAYRGIPLQSAYCAAKHAIKGFVESLRSELIHDRSNVRVSMVHLSAINTPQFSWVKSRLPGKPQPLPPILEPEVAAEGILFASENPRREMVVGMQAVKGIWANKIIPGAIDHYLADKAYEGQQSDELVEPDRQSNLWTPLPGVHATHGEFCDRASKFSLQLFVSKHRGLLSFAAMFAGIAILAARKLR